MNRTARSLTGLPSVDRPWLKYYSDEAAASPLPECLAYDLLYRSNCGHPDDIALIYYDRKFTYAQLFEAIDRTARAFTALGVRNGSVVILCMLNMPETVWSLYALNRLGAVPNMVDPRTDAEQLRAYITECCAQFIVTFDPAYPSISKAAEGSGVKKIVSVPPSGQDGHGRVRVFVPRGVPERAVLLPQKVRKADLLRSVFDERTHAVLPCHALGKGHGHTARVNPKQPVQPPVLRLHLRKRPHPHRLRFCIHDSTAGAVFPSFLLAQKPVLHPHFIGSFP